MPVARPPSIGTPSNRTAAPAGPGKGRGPLTAGAARPAVELSAFSVVDATAPTSPPADDRLLEVVDLAEAAEAAGLRGLWVAEHHFHAGGVCPAPAVLLAACAQRTRRLRLGVLVSVLPFHDPVDLAEQYASVDRLSRGRLELGVGSGYVPLELEGFGVSPEEKRLRFDRGYETLLAALRGEEVRSRGSPVRINVRPVQRPHPPVTIAVQRREAIPFVARRGAGIALIPYATVQDLGELSEEVREYRTGLPSGVPGRVAAAVHVYAGEHPGRARAALQRYLDARLAHQSTHFRAKVERDPRQSRAEAVEAAGFALFGAPREVASRLDAWARAGVDELLGIFDFGGLPGDDVLGSVRSLGRAVRE